MNKAKQCTACHIRAAPFGGKSTIGIGTEISKTIDRDKSGLSVICNFPMILCKANQQHLDAILYVLLTVLYCLYIVESCSMSNVLISILCV